MDKLSVFIYVHDSKWKATQLLIQTKSPKKKYIQNYQDDQDYQYYQYDQDDKYHQYDQKDQDDQDDQDAQNDQDGLDDEDYQGDKFNKIQKNPVKSSLVKTSKVN